MAWELNIFTIKNIPLCKVSVAADATIRDVKKEIERNTYNLTLDRQSLRTELKGKDVNNSKTLKSIGIQNGASLYLKDLGPQIGWKTVFILEYIGPPIIYAILAARPPLIYKNREIPMSRTASIALACWTIHYVKRLYESMFVHRFSHGTMPIRNLFRNCAYYWGFAIYIAAHINHPLFTPPSSVHVAVGTIIFLLSEFGNLSIHLLLRDIRPIGTTVRKIPYPNGNYFTKLFDYVSCPNYTYEFTAWLGFFILTNCLPVLLFAFAGMFQMTLWALAKHNAYMKEFKNYPKRRAIIPLLL